MERTDRLQDAETHCDRAIEVFRDIGDQLGEANTLNGFGNVLLKRGLPEKAFHQHRMALAIQIAIQDSLGKGASLGYMARACLNANKLDQGMACGLRAWQLLKSAKNIYGQGMALMDLAGCCQRAGRKKEAFSALYLCWTGRYRTGDPSAKQLADFLKQNVVDCPNLETLNPELEADAINTLNALLTALEQEFESKGIDPLSPWE